MRKVLVTVSQASDGTFWCHTEKDVYGVGLNAAGQTVKEAKDDLLACLEEARADYEESGKTAEQVEFRYQYDLQSFFDRGCQAGRGQSLADAPIHTGHQDGRRKDLRASDCLHGKYNQGTASRVFPLGWHGCIS